MTSEKNESGWKSGLQEVSDPSYRKVLIKKWNTCMPTSSSPHVAARGNPEPPPEKIVIFSQSFFFHFCTLEMGTFPKHVQKPNLSVFEPTWWKSDFKGFIKIDLKFWIVVFRMKYTVFNFQQNWFWTHPFWTRCFLFLLGIKNWTLFP